jgi:hypothetical protein
MLSKSLQIMVICGLLFCMDNPVAFAANVQFSELSRSVGMDEPHIAKVSFWGLPYPYGFVWRPCYVWRSVLTRHGHRKWYRIRVSDDDCRL